MITNRLRNYDYVNKSLQEAVEPPPIMQHKDNVSPMTIYNTGWTEGYTEGYEDGKHDYNIWNRYTLGFFLVLGFCIGLSIGIWLP